MIEDSIVYKGIHVPCFFVSPVKKYNGEWLGYLQGCDPAAAYEGLCEYFFALAAELDTSAPFKLHVEVFTCMARTFREKRFVDYLPDYVRMSCEKQGVVVDPTDESDIEIRQLWLDKQIQIIQEAM